MIIKTKQKNKPMLLNNSKKIKYNKNNDEIEDAKYQPINERKNSIKHTRLEVRN